MFKIRKEGQAFECPQMNFYDTTVLLTEDVAIDTLSVAEEASDNNEESTPSETSENPLSENNIEDVETDEPLVVDDKGVDYKIILNADGTFDQYVVNDDGTLTLTSSGAQNTTGVTSETGGEDLRDDSGDYLLDEIVTAEDAGSTLVVIDTNIENYQDIIDALVDGVSVLTIDEDPNTDAFEELLAYLEQSENTYSDIRIFSYGSSGEVAFGDDYINAETLEKYRDILKSIGDQLSAGGSIEFYGCSIADGDEGKDIINEIADITGRSIYASTDSTGIGGDWCLEYAVNDYGHIKKVIEDDSAEIDVNLDLLMRVSWANTTFYENDHKNLFSNVELDGSSGWDNCQLFFYRPWTTGNNSITITYTSYGGVSWGGSWINNGDYYWTNFHGNHVSESYMEQTLESIVFNINNENPTSLTFTFTCRCNAGGSRWTSMNSSSNGQTTLRIRPVADAPIVTLNDSTVTEDAGAEPLFAGATVSDLDTTNLNRYAITFDNYDATLVDITWIDQAGITTSLTDNGDGTATLLATGAANQTLYQAWLRSINATCDEITESITITTTHQARDNGGVTGSVYTQDITIVAVNDVPEINLTYNNDILDTNGDIVLQEGDSEIQMFSDVSFSDNDSSVLSSYEIAFGGSVSSTLGINYTVYGNLTVTINDDLIMISGVGSYEDYAATITSITLSVIGEEPEQMSLDLTSIATDDSDTSSQISKTLHVNEIPDAPEVAITANAEIYDSETDSIVISENTGPLNLLESVEITDVDSDTLSSAQITFTDLMGGQVAITWADSADITFIYDSETGILSLSGTATLEEYEAAILGIQIELLGEDPVQFTFDVSYQVFDDTEIVANDIGGDANGPEGSNRVAVTAASNPINDSGTITFGGDINGGGNGGQNVNVISENTGPQPMFDGEITIEDPDNTVFEGYEILLENYDASEGAISWTNTNGLIVSLNVDGSQDSATITINGSGTASDYLQVIGTITYEVLGENPEQREITTTHSVYDGEDWSDGAEYYVLVNEVPDAPVLSITANGEVWSGAVNGIIVSENAGPQNIFDNVNISDVDSGYIFSATIDISGNYDTETVAVGWTNVSGVEVTYIEGTGYTMTGIASIEAYETLLESFTVETLGEFPDEIVFNVSLTVNDATPVDISDPGGDSLGPLSSNTVDLDVYTNEVPDAPDLDLVPNSGLGTCDLGCIVIEEGAGEVFLFQEAILTDVDSENMTSFRMEFAGYSSTDVALTYDETYIAEHLTATLENGVFTIEGTGSLEEYEQAIIAIKAEAISENTSNIYYTISYTITDDTVYDELDIGGDQNGPVTSDVNEICLSGFSLPQEAEAAALAVTDNQQLETQTRFVSVVGDDGTYMYDGLLDGSFEFMVSSDNEFIYPLVTGDELLLSAQSDDSVDDMFVTAQTVNVDTAVDESAELGQAFMTAGSDAGFSVDIDEAFVSSKTRDMEIPVFSAEMIKYLSEMGYTPENFEVENVPTDQSAPGFDDTVLVEADLPADNA